MKKVGIFIVLLFLIFSGCCSLIKFEICKEVILINPYKDINWDTVKRYKANLHTHTTNSDGKETPEKVISLYKERGYSILSITDHYKVTYPTPFIKDGIFLIPGAEIITEKHEILSYFSLKIPEGKGLAVFAHPGLYTQTIDWYIKLFEKYPNIIGIELAPSHIWDGILQKTMPERPVWIFANDDFHMLPHIDERWNVFLMKNLNEEEIKNAMKTGKFYMCSRTKTDFLEMPEIKKLIVDEKKGEIKVECENFKTIQWISDGKVVGEGEKINYKKNPDIKKYLRIAIFGENGFLYLNPFGIKK